MQFKDFQQTVLDTFDGYLDLLIEQRERARKVELANLNETDPDLLRDVPNWPERAWKAMEQSGRVSALHERRGYSSRTSGDGHATPNVTFKIPTGGGKTLLAAAAASRLVNKFLGLNTGFVLWIVPNEAIYTQTRKQLMDRDHPFRQMLDRAAAGRVKILDKDSPLSRADVEANLCVMLLMLQSANRETKESLRLFRDRGNVFGFTPPEGDAEAHEVLAGRIPNLDVYRTLELGYPQVRDSLGNVLRMIRPVVVVDEGHKAFSDLAHRTLYGFNPSFVLELTATPRYGSDRWANCLVDVRGADLEREEMIKLPIELTVAGGDDWKAVLRAAWEETQSLQAKAEDLQANTARYIRPILLVQVERTGNDQRDTGKIHSKDVKEFLMMLGVSEAAIAEKTAETNDLKDPEKQDLLSPTNPVRVIITKQALQEGWDCPFAYVLCALAAGSNLAAMTQLVGRILRQPDTIKTNIPALDRCYVYCFHAKTGDVVAAIRIGLIEDGLGDIAGRISPNEAGGGGTGDRETITRQRRTSHAATKIYFPRVLWEGPGDSPRLLDWEGDILFAVDWEEADLTPLLNRLASGASTRVTYRRLIDLSILREDVSGMESGQDVETEAAFDPVFATRLINDIVPNPWVGRAMVGRLMEGLVAAGWSPKRLGAAGGYVVDELRNHLLHERDRLCRQEFVRHVEARRIAFHLTATTLDWELPMEETLAKHPDMRPMHRREDGRSVERSVMDPVYDFEINGLELDVACYLDQKQTLDWWYRNVVSASGYSLQGWQKNRIYPDFLFALQPHDGKQRLVVLETKGNQLEGNQDTEYKKELLRYLSDHYEERVGDSVGTLALQTVSGRIVECEMVFGDDWRSHLSNRYFG